MKNSTEQKKVNANLEFLRDVMTIAIEGGIDYWAVIRKLERDAELNVISFDVKDYAEPNTDSNWKHINVDKVAEAIEKVLHKKVEIADYLRRDIITGYSQADASEIDVESADCVVQIAAYGEIVFG